jgi:hypothetical protein
MPKHVNRRDVCPVNILDDENHRLRCGRVFEEHRQLAQQAFATARAARLRRIDKTT